MSVGIGFQAGKIRGSTGILHGDGGNAELTLAMRRHANFVEFVPLFLVMLALLELNGVSSTALDSLGGLMVVARACHAAGFAATEAGDLRGIGAGGSALATVVAAGWAIAVYFGA